MHDGRVHKVEEDPTVEFVLDARVMEIRRGGASPP